MSTVSISAMQLFSCHVSPYVITLNDISSGHLSLSREKITVGPVMLLVDWRMLIILIAPQISEPDDDLWWSLEESVAFI